MLESFNNDISLAISNGIPIVRRNVSLRFLRASPFRPVRAYTWAPDSQVRLEIWWRRTIEGYSKFMTFQNNHPHDQFTFHQERYRPQIVGLIWQKGCGPFQGWHLNDDWRVQESYTRSAILSIVVTCDDFIYSLLVFLYVDEFALQQEAYDLESSEVCKLQNLLQWIYYS